MSQALSFLLAQINPVVGDIEGNAAKILKAYEEGAAKHADLVICPELSLIGYPPEDLVLMPSFQKKAMEALHALAQKIDRHPSLLLGTLWAEDGKIFNSAVLIEKQKILHATHKVRLPNYGIFDEKRIFSTGGKARALHWRGHTLGVLVCEDVWSPELAADLKHQSAELLIVINASPFEAGKLSQRKAVAAEAVASAGIPLVYVNTVGGQDDIVYDGGSFIMGADGSIECQLPEFHEQLAVHTLGSKQLSPLMGEEERLWNAMALGLRDYVNKNRFPGVVLGLSGGIDSAITAALAVDALGADKVKGVLLPSPYSSQGGIDDALETGKLLGIETMTIPIADGMEVFDQTLSPVFKDSGWMDNVALGGNLQARLRGVTLMALSNKFGWMLLSTGNKSEIAVGYSTLYGDSCGGYNVLKDLYKTQIYHLAHWRNGKGKVIPENSITKAPSAELAPGQTDQDQLPPYETLDKILALHLEGRQSAEDISMQGFERGEVERIVKMVRLSEYKRRQSCPGVKLSSMLFGKDRRYPLTNKF